MDENDNDSDRLLQELMFPPALIVTFPWRVVLPRIWKHKLQRYLGGLAGSGEARFWEQMQARWESSAIQEQLARRESFPEIHALSIATNGSHRLRGCPGLWVHCRAIDGRRRTLILRNSSTFGHPQHLLGYLEGVGCVFTPGLGFRGEEDMRQLRVYSSSAAGPACPATPSVAPVIPAPPCVCRA